MWCMPTATAGPQSGWQLSRLPVTRASCTVKTPGGMEIGADRNPPWRRLRRFWIRMTWKGVEKCQ